MQFIKSNISTISPTAKTGISTILCSVLLLLYTVAAYGQRLEIGAGVGTTLYKGDLAPELAFKFARPAVNIFLRHTPGRAVTFKYSVMVGKIFADDSKSTDNFAINRNRFFNTRLVELAATAEYNFFNYRNETIRRAWSPYIFGGVALFNFDPVENSSPDYRLTQIGLPFGIGIKYVLRGQWNLGLEFGARKTFTDYLDDLGGELNLNNKFLNGNPNDKDLYTYLSLSVSYTFYKVRCPSFY